MFIKEPDADDSTWSYVLAPLSRDMWWAVATSALLLAFFLSFTWYFGDKYGNNHEDESYSVLNSWISVLASFCQQSKY